MSASLADEFNPALVPADLKKEVSGSFLFLAGVGSTDGRSVKFTFLDVVSRLRDF